MTITAARKLHNEDEVIIKKTKEVMTVLKIEEFKGQGIERPYVLVEGTVGPTLYKLKHTEVK